MLPQRTLDHAGNIFATGHIIWSPRRPRRYTCPPTNLRQIMRSKSPAGERCGRLRPVTLDPRQPLRTISTPSGSTPASTCFNSGPTHAVLPRPQRRIIGNAPTFGSAQEIVILTPSSANTNGPTPPQGRRRRWPMPRSTESPAPCARLATGPGIAGNTT